MPRCQVAVLLLVSACISPQPVEDTAQSGTTVQGQLTESQFQLTWQWRDPWPQGVCLDCSLQNMGPEVPGWTLDISLDENLETIVYSRGASIQGSGNRLTVSNFWGTNLGAGEATDFEFCAEPRLQLEEILEVVIADEETETDPMLYGTLIDQDGTLGLQYQQTGSSNGGECLTLTVKNLTGSAIDGWLLEVEMDDEFTLVDSSVLWPLQTSPTKVEIYPDPGHVWLSGLQETTGEICVAPLVVPIGLISTVNIVEH